MVTLPLSIPRSERGFDLDTSDFFAVVLEREYICAHINMRNRCVAFAMQEFAHNRHLTAAASKSGAKPVLRRHGSLNAIEPVFGLLILRFYLVARGGVFGKAV